MRSAARGRRLLSGVLPLLCLFGTRGEDWESCPVCVDENGVSTMTASPGTVALDVAMGDGVPRFPVFTCGDLLEMAPSEKCNCDCMRLVASVRCGCGEAPTDIECPLCYDGSIPDSLNEELEALEEIEMPGVTCFDLLLGAAMSPEQDDENCTATQELGSLLCGCPLSPDAEAEFCTLCPDGTKVADAMDMSVVYGVDCTVMELAAMELLPETDECTRFQASAGLYCDCPNYDPATEDPAKVCRICGDNTRLPEPHLPSGEGAETCGALEVGANTLGDNPTPEEMETYNCASLREQFAVSCCDPSAEGNNEEAEGEGDPLINSSCPICGDGVSSMTASPTTIAVDWADEDNVNGGNRIPLLTCEELLTTEPDDECDCDCRQLAAVVRCGCPTSSIPQDLDCTMCADGSLPSPEQIDAPLDFLENLPPQWRIPGATCFDLLMDSFATESQEECLELEAMTSLLCGCDPPRDSNGNMEFCTLCKDGEVPEKEDDLSVVFGVKCNMLEVAALGAKAQDDCSSFQATAGLFCGCPNYDIQSETGICRLCGDNTPLPEPYRPAKNMQNPFLTCGAVEIAFATFDANSQLVPLPDLSTVDCDALRDQYAASCCYSPGEEPPVPAPAVRPSEECPICADGSEMTGDPNTVALDAPAFFLGGKDGGRMPVATCFEISTRDPDDICDCTCMQIAAAARCGCPMPTDLPCTLCSDGSLPPDMNKELDVLEQVGFQGATCFDLLLTSTSDELACLHSQEFGAVFCGCPEPEGSEDKETCTLCPDGEEATKVNDMSVATGFNCSFFDAGAMLVDETLGGDCHKYQATAGYYCGCPNYDPHSKKDKDVCRICGKKALPPDPYRTVTYKDQDFLTCGAIEILTNNFDSLRFALEGAGGMDDIEAFRDCGSVQAEFSDACCSPSDHGFGTLEDPTPAPSEANTLGPTLAPPDVEPVDEATSQPTVVPLTVSQEPASPGEDQPPVEEVTDGPTVAPVPLILPPDTEFVETVEPSKAPVFGDVSEPSKPDLDKRMTQPPHPYVPTVSEIHTNPPQQPFASFAAKNKAKPPPDTSNSSDDGGSEGRGNAGIKVLLVGAFLCAAVFGVYRWRKFRYRRIVMPNDMELSADYRDAPMMVEMT